MEFDANYLSLEDDPDADQIVQDLVGPKKQWARTFKSKRERKAYLQGEEPIPSHMGLVVKDITNDEGDVVAQEKRLILNARRSRVDKSSKPQQRAIMPGSIDAVDDAVYMRRMAKRLGLTVADIEQAVADYSDAFFIVPIEFQERRFQCARRSSG